ncbi:hypothetical protein QBC39DRAFT_376546 [Podospora conica]|nr:hypothetical protein QBC39DRAFT_376546 [Schizothecium conicum]
MAKRGRLQSSAEGGEEDDLGFWDDGTVTTSDRDEVERRLGWERKEEGDQEAAPGTIIVGRASSHRFHSFVPARVTKDLLGANVYRDRYGYNRYDYDYDRERDYVYDYEKLG